MSFSRNLLAVQKRALTAKVTYYQSTSYLPRYKEGKLPRKFLTYAVNVELQALYSYFVGTFNKHVCLLRGSFNLDHVGAQAVVIIGKQHFKSLVWLYFRGCAIKHQFLLMFGLCELI